MGKKTKTSSGPSAESVRRLLTRGDAKAALKEARACHGRQPDSEHRSLLEQAYLARVEQLHRKKQLPEARDVLKKLLELGPSLPEVQEKIPVLKVQVGMPGTDAAAVLADNASLLVEMTDAAILDEKALPPDIKDVKARVASVREAFAAVEQGEDSRAAELLAGIPRQSPLSDWKLFLRGLSAFYQADREQAGQNWRRLNPDRPAHRIARTLLVAAGDLPEDQAECQVETGLRRLEARLKSDPAVDLLERLGRAWSRKDWKGVVRGLDRLINRFGESHRAVIDQIVDRSWKQAIRDANRTLLKQLSRLDCARPLDPHWNRAWAMLEEYSRSSSFEEVEKYWRDYAEDLLGVPSLSPEERSIASGLVLQRLARAFLEYATEWNAPEEDEFPFDDDNSDDAAEAARLRRRAIAYYEQALDRAPGLLSAYQELAILQASFDESEQAAATVHRLIERDPNDFTGRVWLANHYLDQDQPENAEPHVAAAGRLKPREPIADALRWQLRVTTIRTLALKRKFDEARAAWEEASREKPETVEDYTLDTLRAGIEYRAKDEQAAETFVKAAAGKVRRAAPVWMTLSATAARFKLPPAVKKIYETRLKEDLKKPIDSVTAGRIARFLLAYRTAQIKYVGRVTHERLFVKAVNRKSRVAWDANDLRDVCRLLEDLPRQFHVRMTLVEKGCQLFPKDPFFLFWETEISARMSMGPFASPFMLNVAGMIDDLKQVLVLADAKRSPAERELVEQAQRKLALLEDARRSSPFHFGGGMDDEDEFEEDEWDDDDDFADSHKPASLDRFREELPPELQGIPSPILLGVIERMAEGMGLDVGDLLNEVDAEEGQEENRKSSSRRKSK